MRFAIVLLTGLCGCAAHSHEAGEREAGAGTVDAKAGPSNANTGRDGTMTGDRPEWDDEFARQLEGSLVIVGLAYLEPAGERLEQLYGVVVEADPHDGVTLRLEGSRSGEMYTLPPDLRAFFPAPPGEYRLRQTGEVVVDPDFTTRWEVTPPAD
ncbi:MAG: hypothetical protein ACLFV8_09315 [Alphaproteobacteria bacterium]